jgi:hypothetical protein
LVVPLGAVIENGIGAPKIFCLGTGSLFEKERGAGPGPLVPTFNIVMVDRIVMDVVEGGEKMAFGAHGAVGGTVKDLAAACVFFVVPMV